MEIVRNKIQMGRYSVPLQAVIVCLVTAGLLPNALAHEGPKHQAVPLLAAPINATWAANHAEDWREKGFQGFLFQGIVDDLRLFPGERAALDGTRAEALLEGAYIRGDWEALILEIAGSVNRLKAAGINRNFLHITLAPAAPYFSKPVLSDIIERRMNLIGDFCRTTGLRGLAIDTASDDALYDYRWDGHDPELDDTALYTGARRFAMRILRAYIKAHPEGEIILIAESIESAGPLWYAFMDGALSSVGQADTIPIRLVFRGVADRLNPEFHREYPTRIGRLFERRLTKDAAERWRRQGGLAFALEPIHYTGDMPVPRYPIEAYRRGLHAAALYGSDYLLILAPEGGWWHVPPDRVAQFAHLRQSSPASVTFAPPVPRTVDAHAPRLSFDGAAYVGALDFQGEHADVMRNERGALLLAWEGIRESLQLHTRRSMITVGDVITGEKHYFTPTDGVSVIPPLSGLLVIEGMSLREYALPAAIWLAADGPFQAGVSRVGLRFGISNPLAAPLRGTLTLHSDTRHAAGGASFPLSLAPGASVAFQRTAQGISYLGERPVMSLQLSVAAEAPITRRFPFGVHPEESWHLVMDAPPVGPPLVISPAADEHNPMLLLCDVRGRLVAYDSVEQRQIWQHRMRGDYAHAPVLLRDQEGAAYVAVVNRHGRLRFFDGFGREKVLIHLDAALTADMVGVADPHGPAIYLAAALESQHLACYAASGVLRWRHEMSGRIRHMVADAALPGLFFCTATRADPAASAEGGMDNPVLPGAAEAAAAVSEGVALVAFDSEGNTVWEARLAAPDSCAPALFVAEGGNDAVICVGDALGGIACFDAHDGTPIAKLHSTAQRTVTALLPLRDPDTGQLWLVRADAACLTALPVAYHDEPLDTVHSWSLAMPGATSLAALPGHAGFAAGMSDGGVRALDFSGAMIWEDDQGTDAVLSMTILPDTRFTSAYFCFISSRDHLVRALHIRGDLIIPAEQQRWQGF